MLFLFVFVFCSNLFVICWITEQTKRVFPILRHFFNLILGNAFVISGKIIIIIKFNANMSTTFDPVRIGQCVKPEYQ